MKITIYTTNTCEFSKKEKEFLASHNLPYEEKNLESNREFLTEMLAVSNNFAGTPVTKIEKDDGQIVVLKGFTDTEFMDALDLNQTVAPVQSAAPAQPVASATEPAVVLPNEPVAPPAPVAPPMPEPTPEPVPTPTPPPVMPDPVVPPSPPAESVQTPPVTEPPAVPSTPAEPTQTTPQDAQLDSILNDLKSKVNEPEPAAPAQPTTPAQPATPANNLPNIPEPNFS